MATLAYPVTQSTTNKLFGPTIGTSFGNSKPTGKSFNTLTNINWKWVLDTNKPTGKSDITTTFEMIGIPLDNKKLSSMLYNSNLVEANRPKLKASVWYANNIKGFIPSTPDILASEIYTSSWLTTGLTVGEYSIAPMYSGNVTIGQLSTPYLYETFTNSNLMTSKISIVNAPMTTPVETINNEKMLTLETGCVMAYGDIRNGWVN